MAYQVPDSGAGHDYLPSKQSTVLRGGSSAGNARSTEASEIASLIHQAEKDAYSFVLRAFKYQTDHLSWEKEELMSDLRKELTVSDDEHRELLHAANTDETLNSIRNWRQTSSYQSARCSTSQPVHDVLPSPTDSTPIKKPRTSKPHSSAGPASGQHFRDGNLYSSLPSKAPSQAVALDPLIGKKAMIRWPEDEQFYEATITSHNPIQKSVFNGYNQFEMNPSSLTQMGKHKLVYDSKEGIETFEWADINKIPVEDIQWIGEDPGIARRVGHTGEGCKIVFRHNDDNTLGAERRVRFNLEANEEFPPQQNVIGNRVADDFTLMKTDVLVEKVERILAFSSPDSLELEKASKILKEHEQDLVTAIATIKMLSDSPDTESEGD